MGTAGRVFAGFGLFITIPGLIGWIVMSVISPWFGYMIFLDFPFALISWSMIIITVLLIRYLVVDGKRTKEKEENLADEVRRLREEVRKLKE